MYITANGRALPCCIAPFSQRGYENYTLGDATQQSLREIWMVRHIKHSGARFTPINPSRPAPIAACDGAYSFAISIKIGWDATDQL